MTVNQTLLAQKSVEVTASGAVHSPGKLSVPIPASVADAIDAAGGLSIQTSMRPSGVVTVRRPKPIKQVDVWNFSLENLPKADEFELEQGDLIVVQWSVDSATD